MATSQTPEVLEQASRTYTTERGARRLDRIFAGTWDAVSAYAATFSRGDECPLDSDLSLDKITLERYEGASGRLTLSYSTGASKAGEQGKAKVLAVSWGLSSTAQDISIYRYCGPSEGANANRSRLEQWNAEPNAQIKAAYQWTLPAGGLGTLSARDQKIADKILAGADSVQRHFPTIRKETRLTEGEVELDGVLDCVSSPKDAPTYFITRATEWLKIDESIEIASDGSQTLRETWLGGASFDKDFYGDPATRWEFGTI